MADAVLSVLAHPDDAEFLCAGTLIRLAREHGWRVHVASMTPGDCGSADGVTEGGRGLIGGGTAPGWSPSFRRGWYRRRRSVTDFTTCGLIHGEPSGSSFTSKGPLVTVRPGRRSGRHASSTPVRLNHGAPTADTAPSCALTSLAGMARLTTSK